MGRRGILAVAVMLVIGVSAVGPLRAAAPSFFAPLADPVALVGRFDFFFATTRCSDAMGGRILSKIDRTGAVSKFATLLSRAGCFEEWVAVAPGLGTFTDARNFVYVTQGRRIVEIDAAGGPARLFFKLPDSAPDTNNGIVFDSVGAWNFDLLIVAGSQVWRLRREASATVCGASGLTAPCGLSAQSPITINAGRKPVLVGGQPAVMPFTYGPCPGGLLTPSEGFMGGSVFCIEPNGAVRGLGLWPGAGGVIFVPPNPCPFGTTDDSPPAGTFFTTFTSKEKVVQFPVTDFTMSPKGEPGIDGRGALVLSATGAGIGLLTTRPPAPPALLPLFFDAGDEHRGADFCGRHRLRIKMLERKGPVVPVAILSARGFDPRDRVNCASKIRFGRIGNEPSFVACTDSKEDVNGDGIADLIVMFDLKTSGLRSGDHPWMTGLFKPHSPDEGFAGGD